MCAYEGCRLVICRLQEDRTGQEPKVDPSVCICAVMRPQLAPHQHCTEVSTCKPLLGDVPSKGRELQLGQRTNLLLTRHGCAIVHRSARRTRRESRRLWRTPWSGSTRTRIPSRRTTKRSSRRTQHPAPLATANLVLSSTYPLLSFLSTLLRNCMQFQQSRVSRFCVDNQKCCLACIHLLL